MSDSTRPTESPLESWPELAPADAAELAALLERIRADFEVGFEPLQVDENPLQVLSIRNMSAHLDKLLHSHAIHGFAFPHCLPRRYKIAQNAPLLRRINIAVHGRLRRCRRRAQRIGHILRARIPVARGHLLVAQGFLAHAGQFLIHGGPHKACLFKIRLGRFLGRACAGLRLSGGGIARPAHGVFPPLAIQRTQGKLRADVFRHALFALFALALLCMPGNSHAAHHVLFRILRLFEARGAFLDTGGAGHGPQQGRFTLRLSGMERGWALS